MEPWVSCLYLYYIGRNMCENLHYKSAYFKQQHNDQAKNSINRQYTERGQL